MGFQGRAFHNPTQMRYITVMLEKDAPKIYGLDKINESKPIFIVEGPFDSLFLDNSVAMAGSDILGRLVGAIIFGFMITNLVTEKSSTESNPQSTEETRLSSGQAP